jgi:hypothetical protein
VNTTRPAARFLDPLILLTASLMGGESVMRRDPSAASFSIFAVSGTTESLGGRKFSIFGLTSGRTDMVASPLPPSLARSQGFSCSEGMS